MLSDYDYEICYNHISEQFVTVYATKHTIKYILNKLIAKNILSLSHDKSISIILDGVIFNAPHDFDLLKSELKQYEQYFIPVIKSIYTNSMLLEFRYKDDKIEDLISYFILTGDIKTFKKIENKSFSVKFK